MKKFFMALIAGLIFSQPVLAETITYTSKDGKVAGSFELNPNYSEDGYLTFEGGTLRPGDLRYEKSSIQDSFGIRVYADESTSSKFSIGEFFSMFWGNGDGTTVDYPAQARTSTSWRGQSYSTQGQITKVPEPSHVLLFGLAIVGLLFWRRPKVRSLT